VGNEVIGHDTGQPNRYFSPVAGLLTGATLWGLIWYPYRLLEYHGMGGVVATLGSYLIALLLGSLLFPASWLELRRAPLVLIAIALSAGWTNLAYVLGVLEGEVMRVLLLFYLAPLWTVPLARIILNERPNAVGYWVILLALGGALVMLWHPQAGVAWPANHAEWYGLSSGLGFALSNVLTRRIAHVDIRVKSLAVFAGCVVISVAALTVGGASHPDVAGLSTAQWMLLGGIGITLLVMSLGVQYGLTHMAATRAIVILLFELVVAAISAYWLAGEVMSLREWVGGTMIVAAALFSGWIDDSRSPAPAPGKSN